MSFQTPDSKCSTYVVGLGKLDGLQYANGVQQYCGIPFAKLPKRWTRSTLNVSWENDYHDGTKQGSQCPRPTMEPPTPAAGTTPASKEDGKFSMYIFESVNEGLELIDHFAPPIMDELSGLVLNLVLPCAPGSSKFPVFAWVHGGSLLFGSSSEPIFDGVNFVSHSVAIGQPVVFVSFNYRIGLGGFLASEAIRDELGRDGHHGCGNFGFTDQQVAFEWIQKYIPYLGGNPDQITAVGESAGGISIGNQLLAASPPRFQRAICMSGLAITLPPWTMDKHEELFRAVCRKFQIDPSQPDVVDRLRQIPQRVLADATPSIQGVPAGSGNPCIDGWFYAQDPLDIPEAPEWLEAIVLGDTYHEGVIFRTNLANDDYHFLFNTLLEHIGSEAETNSILVEYDIHDGLPQETFVERVEHMCGDVLFKIPNLATSYKWAHLQAQGKMFLYHFDQQSRMQNALKGMAYHAYDLLYLFMNLFHKLEEDEKVMAKNLASAWVEFTYGRMPWETSHNQWKVWGPNSTEVVKTEEEDESQRCYRRMRRMLAMGEGQIWKKWLLGVDAFVNKRMNVGKSRINTV